MMVMNSGTIITFYSWKGGVGRSMALANIATHLAQLGRSVLMVDWDLEAPGLDRYFSSSEAESTGVVMNPAIDDTGLMGLLCEVRSSSQTTTHDLWLKRIRSITVPMNTAPSHGTSAPTPNQLHLLPSGEESVAYAATLADFSWDAFYANSAGSAHLEALRRDWAASYDFVLIDSRTGLTDHGGVCTIQMPDWLVLVFTGNEQSLGGGLRVVDGIQKARNDFVFDRMPLNVLPLLSRWDGEKELDLAAHWLSRAAEMTKPLFASWLPIPLAPLQYFERIRIPHVARFSFGEPLPIVTHSLRDEALPGAAYARVAQLFNNKFGDAGNIIDPSYKVPEHASESDARPEENSDYRADLSDEALFQKVRTQEQQYSSTSDQLASYLTDLGKAARKASRFKQAEPLLRRALNIVEELYGPIDPKIAAALSNLATMLTDTKRYQEAETLYRRALDIFETALGPASAEVAVTLNNLAELLRKSGSLAEAETLYRRAISIDEAIYGYGHSRVATGLNNLAELLRDCGNFSDAETLYRRALAIDEAEFGSSHPKIAVKLNNLASLLRESGRFVEAEPLFRRALAIDETNYGSDSVRVATKLNNLAGLLCDTKRYEEAEALYRRAITIDEANYGTNHTDVATDLNNLARLLCNVERFDEAEVLFRRALAIDEGILGPGHADVAIDLSNLAQLLTCTGRFAEAEKLYRRALDISEIVFGPLHYRVAQDLSNLAGVLKQTERFDEAESLYTRAIAIDRSNDPLSFRLALKLSYLSKLYRDTHRFDESLEFAASAMEISEKFSLRAGHHHLKHDFLLENYIEAANAAGLTGTNIEYSKLSVAPKEL